MSEYDFYQIDHTGVNEPDTEKARTDKDTPIRRAVDEKISKFGTNNVGARMASDLTRTDLNFQSKDELADRETITEDTGMGSNVAARATTTDHNPYFVGSTVKKVRDDQAFKMGMTGHTGVWTTVSGVPTIEGGNAYSIDEPGFDVMDKDVVDPSGLVAGKNWPTEGFRSFGGKYDFEPYMGGGIH